VVRCVMMYNDSNNVNITLLNNDNVVVNCMGDYSLDNFLFNTGVESLHVIYKPSICRSVPENGYKIGTIRINDLIKSCVISNEEVKRLADYSSLYGIKDIHVYNFLDLVVDRYKTEDNIIVLFEWIGGNVGIAYIKMGELVEFRRVSESKLTGLLAKLRKYHNCNNIVQFNGGFDFTKCYTVINNMKSVDKDKQIFLAHIPYVIENNGISLFEDNVANSIFSNDDSIEDDDIYSKPSDDESNYKVDTDIDIKDISDMPVKKEKVGFFAKLFGKKDKDDKHKEAGFNFEEYSEEDEEDEDEKYFSQIAQGIKKDSSSHQSFGANPGVRRKFGFFDYLFYVVFMVFLTCILTVGGLQLVYKEKLRLLSGEYDSVVRVKNQMESNVALSKDVSKSPSTKVNQLTSLDLPETFSIRNVDYDGTQYKVNIETGVDDNIDNIKEYLPGDLVIGAINELDLGNNSGKDKKMYEISLLGS